MSRSASRKSRRLLNQKPSNPNTSYSQHNESAYEGDSFSNNLSVIEMNSLGGGMSNSYGNLNGNGNANGNKNGSENGKGSRIVGMAWNMTGTAICTASRDWVKLWDMQVPGVKSKQEVKMKEYAKRSVGSFEIEQIRYLDDTVIGAMAGTGVKFWDTRTSPLQSLSQLKLEESQGYSMFQINPKQSIFTVASKTQITNYDIRNPQKPLASTTSTFPVYSLKWSSSPPAPCLLSSGGTPTKGLLQAHTPSLQPLHSFPLHSSPILNIDLDSHSHYLITQAQENVVMVLEYGDMLCVGVLLVEDQMDVLGCQVSGDGRFLGVRGIGEFGLWEIGKEEEEEPVRYQIQRYSKIAWNPVRNYLAYIHQSNPQSISILRPPQSTPNPTPTSNEPPQIPQPLY